MKKYMLLICLLLQNIVCLQADEHSRKQADLIIFSYDRPLQLYALLESLSQYMTDLSSISIVYRTSSERYNEGFKTVSSCFPQVQFLHQQTIHDFKSLTLHAIESSSSDYVIFAVDDNIVKNNVELHECITWLEQTDAYGFYLKLGTHLDYCYTENSPQAVPPHKQIHNSICSWEFESGEKDWCYPNTVDMTVYRKKDLLPLFTALDYTNPNLLEGKWAAWWANHKASHTLGLFYENSKMINIPLNKVQTCCLLNRDMNLYTPQELLEKFENGYKMDITPLHNMDNKSVHTEYEPTFTAR